MDDRPVWRKRARNGEELRREAEALLLLGPPIVRLLRVEDQVLILEHVLPGTPAAERPDDEAVSAVAATLLALWVPVPARCGNPPAGAAPTAARRRHSMVTHRGARRKQRTESGRLTSKHDVGRSPDSGRPTSSFDDPVATETVLPGLDHDAALDRLDLVLPRLAAWLVAQLADHADGN